MENEIKRRSNAELAFRMEEMTGRVVEREAAQLGGKSDQDDCLVGRIDVFLPQRFAEYGAPSEDRGGPDRSGGGGRRSEWCPFRKGYEEDRRYYEGDDDHG